MAKPGRYRPPPKPPAPQTLDQRADALFKSAVQLLDRGDGRAIDWPAAAAALFKAGFACLDEAGGSERALKVLRKIEGGAYNRLAGNPDDGTPYTSTVPPAAPSGPGFEPAPGRELSV